ncbi:FecR family protein [Leptospira interrogans]
MKRSTKQHSPDLVLSDEAIGWLVKLNSGKATEDDHAAFSRWRQQSREHEMAAQEAEAIWYGIGVADRKRQDDARARRKLTRRSVLGGGAAIIVGAALIESGLVGPHLFADHVTGVGEQGTIVLPDGSRAVLNGNTALSVDFDGSRRGLTLYQGQAAFSVQPDRERPFVVEAEGAVVRATGTVFDIDILPSGTVVTVVEGHVGVLSATGPETHAIASANQRIRYTSDQRLSSVEAVDADAETAWRRGKLIFNGRSLGDVVAELSRHRRGRIVIASGKLRNLEVTGVFDIKDPESILRTIAETLPVEVTQLPWLTVIR